MDLCWAAFPLLFPVSMIAEPSARSKVATALGRNIPRSRGLGLLDPLRKDLASPPEKNANFRHENFAQNFELESDERF